jgi:hypothetical protein
MAMNAATNMSDEDFARLKAELARDLVAAVREELRALSAVPPANDDGLMTTEQAMRYCGFKRRGTFLMHITRGNLVPDVSGKRGRFAEHRFTRATLDRFMKGKE